MAAEAVRAHPDTEYMTCSTCLPTKLQRALLYLQRTRNDSEKVVEAPPTPRPTFSAERDEARS